MEKSLPRDKARACVAYVYERPDWPYHSDQAVTELPEARAWTAELDAARERAAAAARERACSMLVEQEQAAERAAAERAAWIAAHGSKRLQRMVAEGINCQGTYRDERLALERPGWTWCDQAPGDHDDPVNPPAEAFDLLDDARRVQPDAKLAYWTVEEEYDRDGDLKHDEWKGYVAVAEFLDRDIVYGLPDEVLA